MPTEILTPLLNRSAEFDPAGWFHLVAKGRHPLTIEKADGTRRKIVQLVDDKATAAMYAAFNRKKEADPSYRMLVDFEHFSHQKDKSTEAAVWVDAMENRANGIWFQGEWSDVGASAVKNKRYRTISPVWFPSQTEEVSPGVYRPLEINDAGLTNKNNLQGLVPFWNRDFQGREASTHENQTSMNKIIALLGLAATASEDDIVAKVQAFKNRVAELEPLVGKLSTLQGDHDALKNRHTTLLNAAVDKALDEYKGVIAEGGKDAWKNRLTADFDGTVTLLKGIKAQGGGKKAPVHQEKNGGAAATEVGEPDEALLNRKISNRANELKGAAPTRSFDSCWQQAQREAADASTAAA
ncbi:MAG: hypothetical protein NTV51_12190 [Verrucomicrobia bacterium]|nr:hypothetical protein [Verrucomicrobiota bacterium]